MPVLHSHNHYVYPNLLDVDTYNPVALFDKIKRKHGLKNDAALARALRTHPAVISKIRNRQVGLSAENMVRIHDVTGMPFAEIREACGAPAPELKAL